MADEVQKLKIDIYEKQLEKQKIELDYAQLQIRPHFYINCLNIIHSMAQVNLMNEIQEITFQVSVYLRYIFKKSMEPVTLEEELNFTRNYLRVLECMNDTGVSMSDECQSVPGEISGSPFDYTDICGKCGEA